MVQISTTNHRRSFLFLVALIAFLFVCPGNAGAIPLGEYQQRLKQAITALDSLAQVDEDESQEDFDGRLRETVESVRKVLPEQMTVEVDADVCNIDNSSLHKALAELKDADAGTQTEKIEQVIETLRALESRIAERQSAQTINHTKEQAKSKLDTILARPEYVEGAQGPNALSRALVDFFRWLEKLFPKRKAADPNRVNFFSLIARILVIGVAATVLVYVLIGLFRRLGHNRGSRKRNKAEARIVLGERLEPEATATDLLSQAELLARQGDIRAAIRKAYIALLVELGDRKLIRLAQHKTNRDYLNSVRSTPLLHTTMRGLTDSFERHWYGLEQATTDDWQNFRAGYHAALQAQG